MPASVGWPAVASLGPYWVAAVVLAVAGFGKLCRPAAIIDALRALHLPATAAAAMSLGGAEVALALAVFAIGGPLPGVLTAVAYLGFAGAAARLAAQAERRSGAVVGCGCFGRGSAPVGPTHIFANLALAAAALTAVLTSATPSLWTVAPELPALGVAHLLLIGTTAAATIATMTVLPETKAVRIPVPATDPRVHLFGPTIARKPPPPTDPRAHHHGSGPHGSGPHGSGPHGSGPPGIDPTGLR